MKVLPLTPNVLVAMALRFDPMFCIARGNFGDNIAHKQIQVIRLMRFTYDDLASGRETIMHGKYEVGTALYTQLMDEATGNGINYHNAQNFMPYITFEASAELNRLCEEKASYGPQPVVVMEHDETDQMQT